MANTLQNPKNIQEIRATVCMLCGEQLPKTAAFYEKNGFPYCEECLLFSGAETIVRICEKTPEKWLTAQGFYRRCLREEEGRENGI